MAEVNLDIEHLAERLWHLNKFRHSQNEVEAEKVVILSFRSLQLHRIAVMQDSLLKLSIKATTTDNHQEEFNNSIDKALKEYGESSHSEI